MQPATPPEAVALLPPRWPFESLPGRGGEGRVRELGQAAQQSGDTPARRRQEELPGLAASGNRRRVSPTGSSHLQRLAQGRPGPPSPATAKALLPEPATQLLRPGRPEGRARRGPMPRLCGCPVPGACRASGTSAAACTPLPVARDRQRSSPRRGLHRGPAPRGSAAIAGGSPEASQTNFRHLHKHWLRLKNNSRPAARPGERETLPAAAGCRGDGGRSAAFARLPPHASRTPGWHGGRRHPHALPRPAPAPPAVCKQRPRSKGRPGATRGWGRQRGKPPR